MGTFRISVPESDRNIRLSNGRGKVTYTVTNENPGPVRGDYKILPKGIAKREWFAPADGQLSFSGNETQQIQVSISMPDSTPAGTYGFSLAVANEANPDGDWANGDSVEYSWTPIVPPPPRPWKKILVAVAVLILLVGGTIFFILHNKSVTSPNLVGKDSTTIAADLQKLGLKVGAITHDHRGNAAAGTVIDQTPHAGEKVGADQAVAIVVQDAALAAGNQTNPVTAEEDVAVPPVVTLSLANAEAALASAKLKVGAVNHVQTGDGAVNTVVSQTPHAGAKAGTGSVVNITLRDPDLLVTVPDLSGLTANDATARLVGAHLTLGNITNSPVATPVSAVATQTPAAGSKVAQGTAVSIAVRQGPAHLAWSQRKSIAANLTDGNVITGAKPGPRGVVMAAVSMGEKIVGIDAWTGKGCDTFFFIVRKIDGSTENRPGGTGFGRAKSSNHQELMLQGDEFFIGYSCEHGDITDAWTFYTNTNRSLRVGGNGHPPSSAVYKMPVGRLPNGSTFWYELVGASTQAGETVDSFKGSFRPHFMPADLQEPNFRD